MINIKFLILTVGALLPSLAARVTVDVRDAGTDQDCAAVGPHIIGHYTLQPDGSGRTVPGTRPVCLAVGQPAVGAPIGLIDCALTDAFNANWCVTAGVNPTVRLANTTLCLDATSKPADNTGVIVAECNPGRKSQSWTWTSDGNNNTLSLTFGHQCINRKNGTGVFLDTTQCTTQEINNNQQWFILPAPWFIGS